MEDESKKEEHSVEVEFKMQESCIIEKNFFFFLPQREEELDCFEEEVDSKMEDGEIFDQMNRLFLLKILTVVTFKAAATEEAEEAFAWKFWKPFQEGWHQQPQVQRLTSLA